MKMRYVFLCVLAALCSVHVSAQRDISLDGEWQMTIGGKGYKVNVPHTYNMIAGLEDYAGEAVYKRSLPMTADMKGQTVRLHFEAVYHDAIVLVNGQKAGEHIGKGYTPFSFDITKMLDLAGENILEVRTSNDYSDRQLPFKRSFDWSNDGGIYRSVRLHVSGKHSIRYVHATPNKDGQVRFELRLWNGSTNKVTARFKVTNRQTKAVVWECQAMLSKKKDEHHFSITATIDQPQLWHFDQPNLYDFTCETIEGSKVSDSLSDHFGFLDFKVEGRSFVLNGEKVRLPGIEDMPGSHPEYGMAEPKAFIDQTARLMKDLNTCITRFHWPQDRRMLDAMDEMGILCTEQIPWWQQPAPALGELRQNAREQLEEMIEADYNHPSIFAWGLANEVWGCHDDLRWLRDIAMTLDPQRMNIAFSHETYKDYEKNPSCVLDIPTWNEYTGAWHGPRREDLPGRLEKIDSALSDRPLMITEAGLCEPAFTGGDGRRIDDMIYHVKEWQKAAFIPGYIYFCVQDYRTQMGEEGLGKWRIRRHGVTKVDLTPKPSYYVMRQLMSPIEITEVYPANSRKTGDALAGQIEIDATDRDAAITLRVKNSIPSYTLRGYTLIYRDGNGQEQTIALPDMEPDKSYSFVLKNINAQYAFEIQRPGGYKVIEY